jgi:hypothetical protein
MSVIKVNNITNLDGTSGPVIAGIATVSSTSHMVVPTGNTGTRYADGGENIVKNGLVAYLDVKYSYPNVGGTSKTDTDVYNWYDMTGNGYDGELINFTGIGTGVGIGTTLGGTINFDGSDDYILISKPISFPKYQSKTISVWFNTESTVMDGVYNVRLLGFNNNASLGIGNPTNTIGWYSGGAYQIASVGISSNTWYNITYVFDSNEDNPGTHKTYSNGVLGISSTASSASSLDLEGDINNSPIWIGRYYGSNNGRFKGKLANIMIYNRALTAAEVLQNYNANKSRFGL